MTTSAINICYFNIHYSDVMAQDEIAQLFAGNVEQKASIEKVEVKLSEEIFGEQTKVRGDKVIQITTKSGKEAHKLPKGMEYDEKSNSWKVVDQMAATQSVQNRNSWFGKFYQSYRSFPVTGLEVGVTINPKGFVAIKV